MTLNINPAFDYMIHPVLHTDMMTLPFVSKADLTFDCAMNYGRWHYMNFYRGVYVANDFQHCSSLP